MQSPSIPEEQRLCPILSLATLAPRQEPSRVMVPGKASNPLGMVATPCQGPRCAWWVPISGADGKIAGGQCAAALLPAGLSQVTNAILAQKVQAQDAAH
jgi:hypothetical protein